MVAQLAGMLLFRSLTLGMLGACFWLFQAVQPLDPPPAAEQPLSVSIVDVAPDVDAVTLLSLIRLAPAEHVIAVDGAVAINDLAAGALIRERMPATGGFLDLTVEDGESQRRVLVLKH